MLLNNVNQVNKETATTSPVSFKKMQTFRLKKPVDDIDKAVQCFLRGETGKFGKYLAVKNALVYRTIKSEDKGVKMEVVQDIIALKIERPLSQTIFLGNSSVLPLIGRTVSFGRESNNRSVTEVQTRLSRYIQMIPFNVFFESGLNLMNIEILARGPEKTVIRNEEKYNSKTCENDLIPIEVHFTGASLFKVEDKVFLFDIDQREIKHKIFNAFLVQLKESASSIEQAYENLKPQEVKDAEKQGLDVLRQGEWFFIPVTGEFEAKTRVATQWDKRTFEPLVLRAGKNRPNNVTKHAKVSGVEYVTGTVEHSGREHASLTLKGWYLPVPNTSIESFTLTGDVD